MVALEKVPATYMFLNPITGEYYVGSTNNVRRRLNEHRNELTKGTHHCWKFQRAYNNNPNFEFRPVLTPTRQDAQNLEQNLIDEGWGDQKLLNVSKDTESFRLGCTDSDETRLKKSLSKKGIPQSAELVEKRAQANRGQTRSLETCSRIGSAKKGNQYWLGKTHSEESRQAISQAKKKPVSIDGQLYPSISDAAKQLDTSIAAVHRKVSNPNPKWSNWSYVTAEQTI